MAVFYSLYAVGAYLTLCLGQVQHFAAQSDLVVYLTSPFGSVENMQSGSASWSYGIVENFLLVTAIMVFVASYHLFLTARKPRVATLPSLFFAAVASTYLVSLLVWIATGTPASGSSIIAFSLLAYLSIACAKETWSEVSGSSSLGSAPIGPDALMWTGQTAVILLLSLYYVFGNSSAAFHVGGAVLTGAILIMTSHAGSD